MSCGGEGRGGGAGGRGYEDASASTRTSAEHEDAQIFLQSTQIPDVLGPRCPQISQPELCVGQRCSGVSHAPSLSTVAGSIISNPSARLSWQRLAALPFPSFLKCPPAPLRRLSPSKPRRDGDAQLSSGGGTALTFTRAHREPG